jgi:hypothetical protein
LTHTHIISIEVGKIDGVNQPQAVLCPTNRNVKKRLGWTGLMDRILDFLDQQAWYQSARRKKKEVAEFYGLW